MLSRLNGTPLFRQRLMQATKLVALLSATSLAACATQGTGRTISQSPKVTKQIVCWAEPFEYNSTKADSPRHAGPKLAQDLKRHNFRGTNLGCWK